MRAWAERGLACTRSAKVTDDSGLFIWSSLISLAGWLPERQQSHTRAAAPRSFALRPPAGLREEAPPEAEFLALARAREGFPLCPRGILEGGGRGSSEGGLPLQEGTRRRGHEQGHREGGGGCIGRFQETSQPCIFCRSMNDHGAFR